MKGKVVVVTGAGSGIGLETADALARRGAALILVELDRTRGEAAVARIETNGLRPRLFLADLALQAEVRRVAREILAATPRIDVLINNAGAWFNERKITVDRLERTFALNHIGYFLLTNLLLERIIASAPARIISVASDGHAQASLEFDDLQSEKNYSGLKAYCRSKLANILFTRALARRLEGSGVTANCLHPGHILSNFFENVTPSASSEQRAAELISHGYVPTAEGAKTPIYLACSEQVEFITGQYFVDCRQSQPSDAARDDASAERLWLESLRLSGLRDDAI